MIPGRALQNLSEKLEAYMSDVVSFLAKWADLLLL